MAAPAAQNAHSLRRAGLQPGARAWFASEDGLLVSIVQDVLPVGADMWAIVAQRYNSKRAATMVGFLNAL